MDGQLNRQSGEIRQMQPKAAYYDEVLSAPDTIQYHDHCQGLRIDGQAVE